MKTFQKSFLLFLGSLLFFASSAFAQAPRIFFSDLPSGPNAGGENVGGFAGTYVTLYGNFLGSSQGTSSVTLSGASCLRVVSWGTTWQWYQKIVVQLGASCTSGNFVVTTSAGASNGVAFTVRSGNIYSVTTTGSDSASGSFAAPLRTIVACKNKMVAGDICYIGAGVVQSAQETFEAALSIEQAGTAASPKALVGYPGANPQPQIGGSTGTGYGIRVADIGVSPHYWIFAGLHIYDNGGNSAISVLNVHDWTIVGNLIECPGFNAQRGCIQASQSTYVYFYGNEVTNTGVNPASGKQSHSVYFSTDANHAWAAWNHIHDNYTCRAIQFHSSPVGGSTGQDQYDLHVHDNVIHGDNCDGINFATVDPSKGTVEAYNNLIYHVGLRVPPDGGGNFTCIAQPGIVNAGAAPTGTVQIYNNTLYDCSSSLGQPQGFPNFGAVGNDNPPGMALTNNLIYQPGSQPYLEGSTYNEQGFSGTKNLWFGQGSGPSQFTSNINADPSFVNLANKDFHLQSTSPAINAGVAISTLTTDITGILRPQGSAIDIGAYEYNSGGPAPPPPPTLLSVQPVP